MLWKSPEDFWWLMGDSQWVFSSAGRSGISHRRGNLNVYGKSAEHAKIDFVSPRSACVFLGVVLETIILSPFPLISTTTSAQTPSHRFSI